MRFHDPGANGTSTRRSTLQACHFNRAPFIAGHSEPVLSSLKMEASYKEMLRMLQLLKWSAPAGHRVGGKQTKREVPGEGGSTTLQLTSFPCLPRAHPGTQGPLTWPQAHLTREFSVALLNSAVCFSCSLQEGLPIQIGPHSVTQTVILWEGEGGSGPTHQALPDEPL